MPASSNLGIQTLTAGSEEGVSCAKEGLLAMTPWGWGSLYQGTLFRERYHYRAELRVGSVCVSEHVSALGVDEMREKSALVSVDEVA